MRFKFRVKFREFDKGRDGGLGPVKAFKCIAKDNDGARRKLRKRGRIISIRKLPNNSR